MNQTQFEVEFRLEVQFHSIGVTQDEIDLIIEAASYMSDYERSILYNALIKLMKAYH
jgi:hypothetical protein